MCTGIATYLLVNASGLERPGHVTQLELVDLGGDSLSDLVITPDRTAHSATTLYNSSAFFPPDKFFYIKVFVVVIFVIRSTSHFTVPFYHIGSVKVLCPTRNKIGHFGDVLPSQSLGLVLKIINQTQQ